MSPRRCELGRERLRRGRIVSCGAFTLIEVVLAIALTTGLLLTVLVFYQAAATLRRDLEEDLEGTAEARLLLDRIATELRGAVHQSRAGYGMKGGETWIEFVTAVVPTDSAWNIDYAASAPVPQTDLEVVRYELKLRHFDDGGFEDVSGRNVGTAAASPTSRRDLDLPAAPAGAASRRSDAAPRPSTPQTGRFDAADAIDAGLEPVGDGIVRAAQRIPTGSRRRRSVVVAPRMRRIRLRYFDGVRWQTTWNRSGIPIGVEIGVSPALPPADVVTRPFDTGDADIAASTGNAAPTTESRRVSRSSQIRRPGTRTEQGSRAQMARPAASPRSSSTSRAGRQRPSSRSLSPTSSRSRSARGASAAANEPIDDGWEDSSAGSEGGEEEFNIDWYSRVVYLPGSANPRAVARIDADGFGDDLDGEETEGGATQSSDPYPRAAREEGDE